MASQILGMPAGDAGSSAGGPDVSITLRRTKKGDLAGGVRRGRIRVPAPVRVARGLV